MMKFDVTQEPVHVICGHLSAETPAFMFGLRATCKLVSNFFVFFYSELRDKKQFVDTYNPVRVFGRTRNAC